jgi:antitoxin component YwqK of YwqJK toxin-antitoxin module
MQRVPESNLDYNAEEGIYYYGDRPFTGVTFTEYPNGSRMSETSYENGLFHGVSRVWRRTGQLEAETSCSFGAVHGTSRTWHANSQLEEEGEYEHAALIRSRKWDEAGNLVEEYRLKESDPAHASLLHSRKARGGEAPRGGAIA